MLWIYQLGQRTSMTWWLRFVAVKVVKVTCTVSWLGFIERNRNKGWHQPIEFLIRICLALFYTTINLIC